MQNAVCAGVRALPEASFFEGRPGPRGLEVLLLDHNYVSEWSVTRLALNAAHSLTVLTLSRNPLAMAPDYRAAVRRRGVARVFFGKYARCNFFSKKLVFY